MFPCTLAFGVGRKQELVAHSPLWPAAGALRVDDAGAVSESGPWGVLVTPALTLRKPAHAPAPARTTAGCLLPLMRGMDVHRALRQLRLWTTAPLPVIAALSAQDPTEAAGLAARLSDWSWVQALELHVPDDIAPEDVVPFVRAAADQCDLPCLVRVPMKQALSCAQAAEAAGADGVVVAAPPTGRTRPAVGGWSVGELHSPALLPLYAELVAQVSSRVSLPIVARGGIAEGADVVTLLAAGAVAVQVDSILLVRPMAGEELYAGLQRELSMVGASDWDGFLAAIRERGRTTEVDPD